MNALELNRTCGSIGDHLSVGNSRSRASKTCVLERELWIEKNGEQPRLPDNACKRALIGNYRRLSSIAVS